MDTNGKPTQVEIDGRTFTGEVPQDILRGLAEQHCDRRTSDLAIEQMERRLLAKGFQPDIKNAEVCYGPRLDEYLLGGATLPEMICQEIPPIWWQTSSDRENCGFELEKHGTTKCEYCDKE